MTNTAITAQPTAATLGANEASGFEITLQFPTVSDASAFAALLPKSIKARSVKVSGRTSEWGQVIIYGQLAANGVNGGKNEAGIKRYRAAVKSLARLGIELEFIAPYGNSYPTLAAFEAAIA